MMLHIIALLAAASVGEVFQTKEVSINVDISSNIYTYEVTNLSTDKIVGFEVGYHAAYNFQVPTGWHEQTGGGIFKAWTEEPDAGIAQNETAEFSDRVSSQGAVLGSSAVKVHFQSGKTVIVPDVWAPVHEPRSYIFLVATVIICIMCLHTAVIVYRKKQNR